MFEKEKICFRCAEKKTTEEFHKSKKHKSGTDNICKKCRKLEYDLKDKTVLKERRHKHYEENKEVLKAKRRIYRDQHLEQVKEEKRIYSKVHKEQIRLSKLTPTAKFSAYKSEAKKHNREFSLTFEQFISFWQVPCFYCGDPIDTICLDRIDSSKGYTMENVVSCCRIHNVMKLNHSLEHFIFLCQVVVDRFFKPPS